MRKQEEPEISEERKMKKEIEEQTVKETTSHNFILQNSIILNRIPFEFRYCLPLLILAVNVLQVNKIDLINSYQISMDPSNVLEGEWWRLLTYILAIDSKGFGVKDILINLIGMALSGYFISEGYQLQKVKKKNLIKDQIKDDSINRISIYWKKIIFIQSMLVAVAISIISCFVWFIWNRFGPHSYVSIGLVPLYYYYFMRLVFEEKQNYSFEISFLPFKMKRKYKGYATGILLLIFSSETQSTLIIMIYYFVFK